MRKYEQRLVMVVLLTVVSAGCNGCTNSEGLRPAIGGLSALPPRLDFGPTTLGVPVEQTLELSQQGFIAAEIVHLIVSPENGPFRLVTTPQAVVDINRSINVTVAYEPVVELHDRATLTFVLANDEPLVVELEGRGVDARAEVDAPLDFGRPALGATRVRPLTLRNPHETAVPFSLTLDGSDAREFSPNTRGTLQPFEQRQIMYRYAPEETPGRRDVRLSLNACPLCADETLAVNADAVERPLEVEPDPIRMGAVTIDAHRVVDVRVTNATDEPIRVDEIAFGRDTGSGFSLQAPQAAVVLDELESMNAQVSFSPTALGGAKGVLTIRSNAQPEGDVHVPMLASGGGAMLVVVPADLNFKHTPSRARRILQATIGNGGADPTSAPLHVTSVRVEGDGFVLAQPPVPSNLRLRAGERHVVSVAFAPEEEKSFRGTLVVESDDPQSPRLEVPLTGTGLAAEECELTTQPEVVDFGLVRPGKGASLGVRIENSGTETCSLWNQQMTGDDAFTLTRNRGTVLLTPGEAVYMPIAFQPRADGTYEARMTFDTNRQPNATLEVPIRGGTHPTCLSPEPDYLDFGERRLDCGPTERKGFFRNVCATSVGIDDVFLGDGADVASFSILSSTSTPLRLAPGQAVEATVRWTPSVPGYTSRPLFSQPDNDSLPVLLPLSVDAREEAVHDELRVQPAPAKLDLLWVIDNTASMKDERAGLVRSIDALLSAADARGIDYHIGVTTTGVGAPPSLNGETCSGGVNGNESGRLFPVDHSRPRIVHSGMSDRAAILSANLDVGGCHSVEQGLRAATLALSPPLVDNDNDHRTNESNDGNKGFVRPDAHLAVVVVSDEDDESPDTVSRHVKALRNVKPTSPFTFVAIVAPEEGCPTAVEPGTRYLEAAERLGGLSGNVCEDNWASTLGTLADALFQPVRRWTLDAPADAASLEVSIDGVPTRAWHYDAATRSVVFDTLPAPGSQLRFQYREPCP